MKFFLRFDKRRPQSYLCGMIQTLPFGRTGHDSSRLLFGAAALGGVTQTEADRTMNLVLDAGRRHDPKLGSRVVATSVVGCG